MTLIYTEGFEEMIPVSRDLRSLTGLYTFPADTNTLFELVPGRQIGSALRMRLSAPVALDGDVQLRLQTNQMGINSPSARGVVEFDFRKELGTSGTVCDGGLQQKIVELPGAVQLRLVAAGTKKNSSGSGAVASEALQTESFRLALYAGTSTASVFTPLGVEQPVSSLLFVGKWYHVKLGYDLATKSCTLRVTDQNQSVVINYTTSPVSTQSAPLTTETLFWMHPGYSLDNLRLTVADATLGTEERSIVHARPIADGATNNWVPSTGSDNFAMVDDNDADNAGKLDNLSVAATGSNQIDLYTVENLNVADSQIPASATIESVMLRAYFSDPDPGNTRYLFKYRRGGVTGTFDAIGAFFTTEAAGSKWECRVRDTDPFTGLAFSRSDFDNGEFGLELEP